jgi:hypothetical protein
VNVPDQFQKIGLVLTDHGLVAILKEMTVSFVAPVKGNSIAGHEAPHQPAQGDMATPEEEVKMVGQQGPCVATDLRHPQEGLQAGEEIFVILRVPEDPINSPGHDVLEETGCIESWLARHEGYWVIALLRYWVGLVHPTQARKA